ncbi:DUF3604 domain-containing protein [Marinobacter sp. chi1]|uniref:DUF3604 domain-containing protein n=1 Tax=Marinobacter suaedae TaxID=3057675 RepID=A0ABT8W134_9GAMM|nr:DUF3604 domain-containing protein [Marinobacter sp. chi1]MDO3721954.1 DUF3604 domain-containing protein [Marinobacter sp. chi1]
MERSPCFRLFSAIALTCLPATALLAQDLRPPEGENTAIQKSYSPFVGQDFPQNVYFGDTHLHSSWSTDAGMAGATLGPEEAYRFSRGEEVISHLGYPVKLNRPLDFIVLADHAENFGLAEFIRQDAPVVQDTEKGREWYKLVKSGKGYDAFIDWLRLTAEGTDGIDSIKMQRIAWDSATTRADHFYQPGVFTTFVGFEWTSQPKGNNLHRVVVFRDGKERAMNVVPFSAYDSDDPEALWKYMQAYEDETGGSMLAIPHNGNLSNGFMFNDVTLSGDELDADYAKRRMRWEPLYEMTQAKGTGEAHPLVSPDDEFAGQELLDGGNITGSEPKEPDMLPREYARPALIRGLAYEEELGVNPFKFGMIGATDNHTALPTTREDNWFGKAHIVEPSKHRFEDVLIEAENPELNIYATDLSAAGLMGVWATENTREAIFDAMLRKEVFATTGSRIRLRMFAGWDFEPEEAQLADFATQGYSRGVPMGSDLRTAPDGAKAPTFLVRALRDPDGANLDRIQMVKGWIGTDGETMEKIWDVACADGREVSDDRCDGDVGNTVNVAEATYTNNIGDAFLAGHWMDPDFDPDQRAVYYIRVLEIPTPRWTAYDAKFFDVEMPEGTAMEVIDRAYSSPIWYTPEG